MEYVTLRQAAARYHVPLSTMKGWLKKGKFPEPYLTVGRARVWEVKVLDEWARHVKYAPKEGKNLLGEGNG